MEARLTIANKLGNLEKQELDSMVENILIIILVISKIKAL
ncbi:hypothetical protein J2T04_001476 [Chryseobacterium lathyri]|uniref:Uncharacterized protein n=1 Tax=Chryseobacterium lathyri TaxID=395933 RepID=A0ABT9SJI6_9FLAO|nr:hypothetical protein [Chryseobacterium lathyri]